MSKDKVNKISLVGIIIWSIGAIFFLYEFFLRTFLGALASQIIPELSLSPSNFALLASVFYVAYGLMQVPVGAITDTLGVKLSIICASLICALATFWFAHAHSFYVALICRALMGFGGGFAFICLLVITINWFPKKYLALFIGIGQFVGTMGALIAGGPLANVVVTHHIPWRSVFIIIGLVGLVIMFASILFVREKKSNHQDEIVVLEEKESFLIKIKQLLNSGQAWFVALYSAFVFLSVAMLGAVWGTTYLQSLGFSQEAAATIVSFAWLGFACGCPLLGYVSDHFIRRKPFMLLCSIVGLVLVLIFIYVPMHTAWVYAVILFVLGITSAGQSIGFAIITEHVAPQLKAMALGLNSAFITLLAALVPYLVGVIIQAVSHQAKSAVEHYQYSDFYVAFAIMPILYFLSLFIVIFFVSETYCRSQKQMIKL